MNAKEVLSADIVDRLRRQSRRVAELHGDPEPPEDDMKPADQLWFTAQEAADRDRPARVVTPEEIPSFNIEVLAERLRIAEARLLLLAHDGGPAGRPRMEAKAEGVRVALSYISDMTRGEGA